MRRGPIDHRDDPAAHGIGPEPERPDVVADVSRRPPGAIAAGVPGFVEMMLADAAAFRESNSGPWADDYAIWTDAVGGTSAAP